MSDATQKKLNIRAERQVERVEDYQFEPIKGYPMLRWHGKRPFTSTRYYPTQHKETHGPEVDGWRNKLYWGDNLQVMSHLLKEYRGKVKLVYIDPPFDSKADYKKAIQLKGLLIANEKTAFEEKQYTDIWTNDEYLQFMYERLILIRELLAENGTLYLHCDYRKSYLLRCLLDEIFGQERFVNEVVWQRSNPHNDTKRYGSIHDTLFVYTKGSTYTFNTQYTPPSEEYIKTHFTQEDESGRKYTLMPLMASGPGPARQFGDKLLEPPPGTHWRWTQERINEAIKQGIIVFTSGGTPRYKFYAEQSKGRSIQSLWTDLIPINSQSIERTNYPTQKPESLLERVVMVSSNPDDLVFDCFMGSGTTQAVAMKLGRRFIGADINLGAVQITTKRLLQVAAELGNQQKQAKQPSLLDEEGEENSQPTTFYTGFEVYNVNHYDVFRNPVEAKELLIQALEINKLEAGHLFDGEKDGRLWKIMPVNRITTRQDLNDLISNFDYRTFERRHAERPNQPVERLTLVCMGHEPDLAATLEKETHPYKLDVEVVDILRDRQDIQFKRDSQARVRVQNGHLVIEAFYPMNLLSKLSLQQENVTEWRELVESVMIDWNYDGAVLQPATVDIPENNQLVNGRYPIPTDAGTIRLKITDLLSESLEIEVAYG